MPTSPRTSIRRLGLARAVSAAGSEAAFVALVAVVWERTGSAAWVSAAALASVVAGGIGAPLGGALADRFDRRAVMVVSDLVAAACVALMALAGGPALLVALAAVASAAGAPFAPASGAAVPNLAPAGGLAAANAHVAAMRTVGMIVGPVLGGVLVAAGGAPLVFGADALSFVLSAALVASIRADFAAPGRAARAVGGGVAAGFAALRADAALARLVGARTCFMLGAGAVLVAVRPMSDELVAGDVGYGILVTAWGVGLLAGSRLAVPALRRRPAAPSARTGLAVAGACIALGGLAPHLWLLAAALAVAGTGRGLAGVAIETAMQQRSGDGVRGRVLAAAEALGLAALGLSIVSGGQLVDALGPRPVFICAAIGSLLAVAVLGGVPRPARRGREPALAGAPR